MEPVYATEPAETQDLLDSLCPPVRNWFKDKFPDFTEPQKLAIPALQRGDHLLLCSPTGSGKTLTAFLSIINDLVRRSMEGTLEKAIHCSNPSLDRVEQRAVVQLLAHRSALEQVADTG